MYFSRFSFGALPPGGNDSHPLVVEARIGPMLASYLQYLTSERYVYPVIEVACTYILRPGALHRWSLGIATDVLGYPMVSNVVCIANRITTLIHTEKISSQY